MDFEQAWLSYRKRTDDTNRQYFAAVYGEFEEPVMNTAFLEIERAAAEMLEVKTERKTAVP